MPRFLRDAKALIQGRGSRARAKRVHELKFWHATIAAEDGHLANRHFEYFYTDAFGLARSFYEGKRVLDIGCGPRGSLEWCDVAAERVGLDPLADDYRELGIDKHAMTYVNAGSEHIPFDDDHFDVVCSFNSLDHVDDLDRTVAEITRVTKPGGTFLLIVEVNHEPTMTEPVSVSFDVVDRFRPSFTLLDKWEFECHPEGVYKSVTTAKPYDHGAGRHDGMLVARLERVSASP